jgi:hypothetical protein
VFYYLYLLFKQSGVTYRHRATTPDDESQHVNLLKGDVDLMRKGLLQELFGVSDASELSLESLNTLRLPRHEGRKLTAKKLVSLSEKYFSIPPEYLSYYPHVEQVAQVEQVVSENGAGDEAGAGKEADQQRPVADEQRAKKPKNTVAVGAKKPGRPPKHQAKMVPKGQRSLLTFLHSRSKSSNSSSSSST